MVATEKQQILHIPSVVL